MLIFPESLSPVLYDEQQAFACVHRFYARRANSGKNPGKTFLHPLMSERRNDVK